MMKVWAGKARPDICPALFEAFRCCSLDLPFRPKVCDYDHFFHCCHRHGITAGLFENLQKHGSTDPQLLQRARFEYQNQFFSYAGYRDFLEKLHQLLRAAGLQVVLLKGGSLWFTCYSNPIHRHVSDIDILVRHQDRDRLETELNALGYEADREHKLYRDGSGRIIDVHCGHLGLAEESSGINCEKLLTSARPLVDYPAFLTADPLLETQYLAFHAMKHSYLRFSWLQDVFLSCQRHGDSSLFGPLQRKPVDWSLYLYDLLSGRENPRRGELNVIERYLARRMLRVDQHPLGQALLALYQPTWKARLRGLIYGIKGRSATTETFPRRIRRLLREAARIFT